MSGNFVQRAEPAIINKYARAEIALACGADVVVENPVIYATANGEKFADGAIKLLKNFPEVTALAMGCETSETDFLTDIAEIQYNESEQFKQNLSAFLEQGISYASAYCKATVKEMSDKKYNPEIIEEILSKPNNLLCIEYIKSIKRHGLNIKPVLIKRKGNDYNNVSAFGDMLSASAIREILAKNDFSSASPYLPNAQKIYKLVQDKKSANYSIYDAISVYNLRSATTESLSNLYDAKEGIEYKLHENASKYASLEQILTETKSKRYTYARLKRIVLQNNLGITKDLLSSVSEQNIPVKLLGIKQDFKTFLSTAGKNMIIRASDYTAHEHLNYYFEVEKKASSLYSLITNSADDFYTGQFVTVDNL